MTEFLTWDTILTVGGLTIATGIITQIVKGIANLGVTGTRLASSLIAAGLLVLATCFTAEPTLQNIVQAIINGIALGWLSNGAYDSLIGKETGP